MSQDICQSNSNSDNKRKYETIDENEGESSKKMKVDVKAQLKQCSRLLYDFMNRPSCIPYTTVFLYKVDTVKYECPDYYDVIKNPMDLTTMQEKMNRGEYTTPEQFADDIRLIISNCRLYNSPDHEIIPFCDKLQETFEKRYEKIINPPPKRDRTLSNLGEPLRRSSRSTPMLPDDEEYIKKEILKTQKYLVYLYEKLDQIKENKIKSLKRSSSRSNGPKKASRKRLVDKNKKKAVVPKDEPKVEKDSQETIQSNLHASSDEDEDEGPSMTYEEKRALIQNVNKLPNDKLEEVTKLIEKLEPSAYRKNESEIDFSTMSSKTLRGVAKFTNDFYHPKAPRAVPFPRKEKLQKNKALVTELKQNLEEEKKQNESKLADIEKKMGIFMRNKLLEDNSQKSDSSGTTSGSSSSGSSSSSSSGSSSDSDD